MRTSRLAISALALVFVVAATGVAEEDRTSYGYVRTLEGSGAIISADTDGVTELRLNHPVLTGDRVLVDRMSRVELVLPDFNILRLGGDSELTLSRLAYSADSEERVTTLLLTRGELQLVVTEHALGDELPAIVLAGSTVFVHEPGTYRVRTDGERAEVVVRSGYAEVSTERGSAIARSDEAVVVEGTEWPSVAVREAAALDDLELWGGDLLADAGTLLPAEVDPALSYSASTLEEAGEWVEVDGDSAWSPYVEESWRPYTNGDWVTTPAGMYWVGYEPWGWVTGHYGYWSLHHHHGWLWYPGPVWSPAWVHWYWGPNYVGWVPFGYYHSYYGGHLGLSLGFYGWAGGYWHHYYDWTFCPTYYLGHGNGYYYSGREMPERTGRTAVPRGVITTDTGGVDSVNWRDGVLVGETLSSGAGRSRPTDDVTPFIARENDLPSDVVRAVSGGERVPVGRTTAGSPGRVAAREGGSPAVGGGQVAGRHSMTRPGTDRSSAPGAPPALADGATQQWRERGADRRLHTRDRGAGIDRGATFDQETTFDQGATGARRGVEGERQSAWDSASRVREAWRRDTTQRKGVGIPGTRRSGSIGGRQYGAPVGGDSITRPSSPARRVVEGVTSPSRGQTRSRPSAGARAGSGRSQSSTRARAGSGRSRSSTSARSSGGSRRSSATRSSGSGRRSSASSGSTRSRSSGGSKGTRSSGSKRQNGGRG